MQRTKPPIDQDSQAALPKRPLAFHPVLLGAFPVLSLLAHNRHEAHLAWALLPLLVAIILSALTWTFFRLVLRDWAKAAIPASLAILMFFSFGHLVVPLLDPEAPSQFTFLLQVTLGALTSLAIVCALLRRWSRPNLLTLFGNVTAVVVIVMPLLSLAKFQLESWRAAGPRPAKPAVVTGHARDVKPDIYLIVPDAHARADVMRDVYGHDMNPFFGELEAMGFAVARQSSSNYSMTPVSLASMLNFRYLDEAYDLEWGDIRVFRDLIQRSSLEELVNDNGYKTIAFPSGSSYSEMDGFDEYYRGLGAATGFYRMVADLTPLSVLLEGNGRWNALLSDRERLLRTMDLLPRIAHDPAPTFTFVHLQLPHPPFQFGEDGQDVFAQYRSLDDDGRDYRSPEQQSRYPEAYRRQAIYTERRLAGIAREILANSDSPPVIIFMSDHGPRLNLDWSDAGATDVREALGNLVAVYLPNGRASEVIYPTITPVNVIRVALNEALGTEMPLLEDRAHLSTDEEQMHQIADVTVRLRRATERAGSLAELSEPPAESAPATQQRLDQTTRREWRAPPETTSVLQ